MSIDELTGVVPPPAAPLETGDEVQWIAVQNALGVQLPADFRDFGMRYGSGEFCGGYLTVFNPFSPRFEECVRAGTKTLRINKRSSGDVDFPYGIFPDSPGLFPWAWDETGHTLLWLTEGDRNEWPVVIESHEGDFERFEAPMTTFLAKALMNEIRPKHIWTKPFSADERTFEPRR